MNIAYEFSKVKESFIRVKDDLYAITKKVNENYEHFLKEHSKLTSEVEELSKQLKKHIIDFKHEHLSSNISSKELLDIRSEISEIKKNLSESMGASFKLSSALDQIKQNKEDIAGLKKQLHSSELEIYLLKERLLDKSVEIKQLKTITSHLSKLMEELTGLELDILNSKQK